MPIDLVPPQQVWECPHCPTRARTAGHDTRTPMHPCPGKAGFNLPLSPEGARVEVRTVEREDFVGGEDVQVDDDGRPVARVEREHADGRTDVWVYAPSAHSSGR